jgi:uncharacterized protein
MDEGVRLVVPPAHGRVIDVPCGAVIRVTTPAGSQAADFFAFVPDLSEWLSPMHTWVSTRHVRPRVGDEMRTQLRRPLLRLITDQAGGIHDMMLPACDQARYVEHGFAGYHRSCSENLLSALAERGLHPPLVPQPVNLFTLTEIDADYRLVAIASSVPPGAFVEFKALRDATCIVSSCPYDLQRPDWAINAPTGPSELVIDVTRTSPAS